MMHQPIILIVTAILSVFILLAFIFRNRLISAPRKHQYYNISIEERAYNRKLNERKIHSLRTLDVETKALLIRNNIETVGELKSSSLDFIRDLGEDDGVELYCACKIFISACHYKKGKSHLNL